MPEGGAEGVLVAFASFIGGFALWVDEHELFNHAYQVLGSDVPADVGDVTLKMLRRSTSASPVPAARWRSGQTRNRSARAGCPGRSR